jgi:hypothetical protein
MEPDNEDPCHNKYQVECILFLGTTTSKTQQKKVREQHRLRTPTKGHKDLEEQTICVTHVGAHARSTVSPSERVRIVDVRTGNVTT